MATVEVDSDEMVITIENAMQDAYIKAQGAAAAGFSMIAMVLFLHDVPEHVVKSAIEAGREMYVMRLEGKIPNVQ